MQWIVEDVTERRIKQEKCYWREQIAEWQIVIDSCSSGNDEMDNLLR